MVSIFHHLLFVTHRNIFKRIFVTRGIFCYLSHQVNVSCDIGYFINGSISICQPCDPGFYSSQPNSSFCLKCDYLLPNDSNSCQGQSGLLILAIFLLFLIPVILFVEKLVHEKKKRNFARKVDRAQKIENVSMPAATEAEKYPLHYLARNNAIDRVNIAREFRHINVQNMEGQSPLHVAIYCNSEISALFLIAYGANISLRDKKLANQPYAMKYLISSTVCSLWIYFYDFYDVPAGLQSMFNEVVLACFAIYTLLRAVQFLRFGLTPQDIEYHLGNEKLARIDKKVTISGKGIECAFKELEDRKCFEADDDSNKFKTPLHKLAFYNEINHINITKYHKFINVQDEKLRTPLHIAVYQKNIEATIFLCAYKARRDLKDNSNIIFNWKGILCRCLNIFPGVFLIFLIWFGMVVDSLLSLLRTVPLNDNLGLYLILLTPDIFVLVLGCQLLQYCYFQFAMGLSFSIPLEIAKKFNDKEFFQVLNHPLLNERQVDERDEMEVYNILSSLVVKNNEISIEISEKKSRIETIDEMNKAWHVGGKSYLPPLIPKDYLVEWTDKFSEEIGSGGFGTVYKGLYHDGGKVRGIAVKKFHDPSIVKELLKSFDNEIKILSNIRHYNIIRLVGYYYYKPDLNNLFLVYEHCEKGDLAQLLNNDFSAKHIDWKTRISIAYEIAVALNYLHNRKDGEGNPVLHRDIKAENIGITWNNKSKLLDMGLAKMKKRGNDVALSQLSPSNSTTAAGQIAGTNDYLDIQYLKENNFVYDVMCDIYSFGILLCELLFGVLQGSEIADGRKLLFKINLVKKRPADFRAGEWQIDCLNGLRNLIEQCMDSDWETVRPRSMNTIVSQLKKMTVAYCSADIDDEILLAERKEMQDQINILKLSQKDEIKYTPESNEKECAVCKSNSETISSCENHSYCIACFEKEIESQCDIYYREYFIFHGKSIVCSICLELPCPDTSCKTNCVHNIFKFNVGNFAKKIDSNSLNLYIKNNTIADKAVIQIDKKDKLIKKIDKREKIESLIGILNRSIIKSSSVEEVYDDYRKDFNSIIAIFEEILQEIVKCHITKDEMEERWKEFINKTTIGASVSLLYKSERMPLYVYEIANDIRFNRNRYFHPPDLTSPISAAILQRLGNKMVEVLDYYIVKEEVISEDVESLR